MPKSGVVLSLWFGVLAIGCERTSDIGAAAMPACQGLTCDAGSDSAPVDSGPPLPIGDPRFDEPASDDEYAVVAEAFDGTWWGVSTRAEERGACFEIDFTPSQSATGSGTFRVRCLPGPGCDPFGRGSAEERGTYTITQVTADNGSQGELSWLNAGLGRVIVPFWGLRLRENRTVMAFTVDLGGPRFLETTASVVLTRGTAPSDGLCAEADARDGGGP